MIAGEIAIARKDGSAIVILREHDNVRLIISGAAEKITFTLGGIVRRAEISISHTSFYLETAKPMFQNDVENSRDSV